MDYDELVDRVAQRTHGTRGDPLTRDDVEQIVQATIAELAHVPELEHALPTRRHSEADPAATDEP